MTIYKKLLTRLVGSFLFLYLGELAPAQEYQIPPPLKLTSGRRTLLVPQKNGDGPHDYFSESCRGSIDRTKVHAVIRSGRVLYIVYTWSRGAGARMARCGAGWESQINLVSISDGLVTGFQQMDIESCWRDTFGTIVGWRGGTLTWSSDRYDSGYSAFFDPSHPERGLQIKETHNNPS